MPTCEAIKHDGLKCGRGTDYMPYFWFNDSEGIFDKKFILCQEHSQEIFNRLLKTEYSIKTRIDERTPIIQHLKSEIRKNGASSKNPELQHQMKIEYEKKTRLYEILNDMRNKTCRLCSFPLSEPHDPNYQTGNKYSHADLHSIRGYRREVILFHTKCGRIWIMNTMAVDAKIRQRIMPSQTGQFTIDESLTSAKLMVN